MKGESQTANREVDAEKGGGPADEELMMRFKGGDSDAMNEIIARHGSALFGFLVRHTGSHDKAEDAYQDVFLKVVRGAKTYKPSAKFTSWLYTIARNVVIDTARRDKYRETESLDEPAYEDGSASRVETTAGANPNPEEVMRGTEMQETLEKAITGLPDEQREVFLLREKSGLPFKEIAKITGAPLNTVKTRMHYALNSLRKALMAKGYMAEEA
jgi:RNA polymerase sigma-70 factor (ECF subfamily)